MRFAATGGIASNAVDIFNASSGRWSTAVLSAARMYLAATSLPNQGLAIFAGGYSGTGLLLYSTFDVVGCCVWLGGKGRGMCWLEGGVF